VDSSEEEEKDKEVGLRKTKTRKEFIHCRYLVPLVGGKPGDFETCQKEGKSGYREEGEAKEVS
jgi:hypothetical protein